MPCNEPSGAQIRIDLAFRRLQFAFLRAAYDFEGETLEAAVKRAAQVIEDRGERDDFLPDCDEHDTREHWWTPWVSNPFHALREDRFCYRCGTMETQTLALPGTEHGA